MRPKGSGDDIYVPRDEAFTERKAGAFTTKKLLSGLAAFTTAQKLASDKQRSFPSLAAIDALQRTATGTAGPVAKLHVETK